MFNSNSIGSSTQNIQKMYKLTNGYRAHQKKQEIPEIIRIQVLIAQKYLNLVVVSFAFLTEYKYIYIYKSGDL